MDLFNFTKPKELYDERKKKFNEENTSSMNFSSNPLLDKTDENLRTYNEELEKMIENIELYYAPKKILDINNTSTEELSKHLNSIFNDPIFCLCFSKIIKKDKDCPTGKEAKGFIKKYKKKCLLLKRS